MKTMLIKRSEKGFTLLEVIITIVIAAILGSFLVTFMGSVPKSANPVIQTQNLAAVQAVMEHITADYETYLRTGAPAWANIGSGYVTNETMNSATICSGTLCSGIPITVFTMREVTVTSGDQKLVSYFVQ